MLQCAYVFQLRPVLVMLRLLVVEDHVLVREGLVQTLRQLATDVSVHEAADCDEARAELDRDSGFDMILLDLGLPGLDGLSFLGTLHKRFPNVSVVILSAYDDAHTVSKAMKSGAAGFVPKTYSSDQLLSALREVLAGGTYVPGRVSPGSAAPLPGSPIGAYFEPSEFGLTERQAEVLGLMASGKSNRDIANLLGLSEGTVKIHMTAIFKALGVSSRTQAMVVIARQGIRL